MQTGENAQHGFTLANRSHAEISGVVEVDCFNEEMIVLNTALGAMTVCGRGLNISDLSQEKGRVAVDGEFDSVEYSGKAKKGGFFSRLLR